MKNFTTQTMGTILKWALVFVFIFGLFFTPFCHYMFKYLYPIIFSDSLPLVANGARGFIRSSDGKASVMEYRLIIMELYTLGIAMLSIVWQLIRICIAIEKNKPFTADTTSSLKKIALISLTLIVIYVVKFAICPTLPGLLVAFTFVIIGMISTVFSQLFKKATEYREENEFTI